MIEHNLDRETGIVYAHPKSAMEAADFVGLATVADPARLRDRSARSGGAQRPLY